jgi:hypothetical protein
VKRKGLSPQLSSQQQLILALVLIVLVAVSLLYCLGFASVLLRNAWENVPVPRNDANPTIEIIELTPLPEIEPAVTDVVPH